MTGSDEHASGRELRVAILPGLSVANIEIGEAMLQVSLENRREGVMENAKIRAAAARYRAIRGDLS